MIKPIQDYVLVKLKNTGLFTGDKKLGDYVSGEAVALGEAVKLVTLGQKVYWQQYSEGAVIEVEANKYTLVKEENIMGVENATNN